jgi:hypothetical protein
VEARFGKEKRLAVEALMRLQARLGLSFAASLGVVRVILAPIVEEVTKSVGLVYFVRRTEFTYFVDGAIYGFAAGTAFAIIENLNYLEAAHPDAGLGQSVNRALSTSLMHGSASALVGVSLGRFRFGRSSTRLASLLLGWGAAIALHSAFNWLVGSHPMDLAVVAGAMCIGFAGLALTVLFIKIGLREERKMLRARLREEVSVTTAEAGVVDCMAELRTLLAPVEARFGKEKRLAVEALMRLQARLGLKSWARSETRDPGLAADYDTEIQALRTEMDVMRRSIGVYCMAYVRSIMPRETEPMWDRLQATLAEERDTSGINIWSTLDARSGGAQGEQDS